MKNCQRVNKVLRAILFFILGWVAKFLYDWKIHPLITGSQKLAEKRKADQEEKERQERESRDRSWKRNKEILESLKNPLQELNSVFSFPEYTALQCTLLLRSIKEGAEQIDRAEFRSIREKLAEFSKKMTQISSWTPRDELLHIITGKYDRLNPQDLLNELDTALKNAPK
jgi:hypothetical protein